MGDASNYHYTLACGLRQMGHNVTVASAGSRWMNTLRDIDLSRRKGKIGGGLLWLKLNTVLAGKLKGYDVVQIHNPVFLDQMPKRVRAIFDKLKRDNGNVFLTLLGTDSPYVEMCLSDNSPLRYNEFTVDGNPTPYSVNHRDILDAWRQPLLTDHCNYIYDRIDGAVSALYEYHLAGLRVLPAHRLEYAGIPISLSEIPYANSLHNGPLRIVVACHKGREDEKGIDRILPIVRQVVDDNPGRACIDIVQNVPFNEFRHRLQSADIVVDQLYSYTPATSALMAMAAGKIVISGAEPEYYDFLGEDILHPIINANPMNMDGLYRDLERVIRDDDWREELSSQGRQFVEKHNDMRVVAARFVDFWERSMR